MWWGCNIVLDPNFLFFVLWRAAFARIWRLIDPCKFGADLLNAEVLRDIVIPSLRAVSQPDEICGLSQDQTATDKVVWQWNV